MKAPTWLIDRMRRWAVSVCVRKPYDRHITDRSGKLYLCRWYIIPRNPLFNIYLHRYVGDDPGRALHDHPWWSLSFVLRGRLREERPDGGNEWRAAGDVVLRSPRFAHRLSVASHEHPPLTLFITGPRVRRWGFLTKAGWVRHDRYDA